MRRGLDAPPRSWWWTLLRPLVLVCRYSLSPLPSHDSRRPAVAGPENTQVNIRLSTPHAIRLTQHVSRCPLKKQRTMPTDDRRYSINRRCAETQREAKIISVRIPQAPWAPAPSTESNRAFHRSAIGTDLIKMRRHSSRDTFVRTQSQHV